MSNYTFTPQYWIIGFGALFSLGASVSLISYLYLQRVNGKAPVQNKFDYLMIGLHTGLFGFCTFGALAIAFPYYDGLWLGPNQYYGPTAQALLALLIICYINLLYLRSAPILETYVAFKWYRYLIIGCSISFVTFAIINISFVSLIDRSYHANFIIIATRASTFILAAAVLQLITMDVMQLVFLNRYIKELKSVVETPTSALYSIIANHGIICAWCSLVASALGITTTLFYPGLEVAILYVFLYCALSGIVGTLVRMKWRLNGAELLAKRARAQHKPAATSKPLLQGTTQQNAGTSTMGESALNERVAQNAPGSNASMASFGADTNAPLVDASPMISSTDSMV
ncbi:hypothetical protein MP228_005278 [Amoeboaphelidium protococcarum]|nr:hypothetical protein MP228_005278 [Amoeboaphelidium protococcarum]